MEKRKGISRHSRPGAIKFPFELRSSKNRQQKINSKISIRNMEFLNRHSQCLMFYSPNKKSTHMQCLSYGGEISNLMPTRLAYHQMRPRFKPHHFKVSITLWSEILKTALVKRGHSFAHSFAPQRSARSVVRSATLRFAPLAPLTPSLASLAPLTRSLTRGNVWFLIRSVRSVASSVWSDHSAGVH